MENLHSATRQQVQKLVDLSCTLPFPAAPDRAKNACPYLRCEVGYRPTVGAHGSTWPIEVAQTKVGQFDLPQTSRPRQEDVVQLHITMANVLVVCVAHSTHDLMKQSAFRIGGNVNHS